jgi:hypothetical protein
MRSHIFATSIIRPSIRPSSALRYYDSHVGFKIYRISLYRLLIIKYVFTTCVHIASDKQLLVLPWRSESLNTISLFRSSIECSILTYCIVATYLVKFISIFYNYNYIYNYIYNYRVKNKKNVGGHFKMNNPMITCKSHLLYV